MYLEPAPPFCFSLDSFVNQCESWLIMAHGGFHAPRDCFFFNTRKGRFRYKKQQMPGCTSPHGSQHAIERFFALRIIEAARPCTPLGTAGSSLSRVASPPILARRATPPTGKHGPLPPALDFYAPRISSLTLHSRAQRAPPPFRTCITCSCSWDRHENGNPHAVYSRGQGGAARADAPSPWRALPAQCAHDSARRGGWNNPRLVMTRLISVFRVPFE